ncbi:hypothetical protein NVV76_08485 [Pediococcus ethanolidurans]|nr:hypothetical protein [Pediococcus ethanolidurans]MCV3328198.1 hypothetical protein [Pediococcus ethanolidurans]
MTNVIKSQMKSRPFNSRLTISEFTRLILSDVTNNKFNVKFEIANNRVNSSLAEVVQNTNDSKKLKAYSDVASLEKELLN